MKKTLMTITAAAMALGSAQAVQILMDDFEGYSVANPAANPLIYNPFDPGFLQWTPSTANGNDHRIFDTALYGNTRLWISLVDGSSLSSSGIAIQSDMTYTLDFFAAAETNTVNRGVNGSIDILVGTDIGSATSVLGGTQDFTVFGDSDSSLNGGGNGTSNDKSDHMYQYSFDAGTVGAGDQMFMVFTRVETNPDAIGGGAWFAIDDVSIDQSPTVPEPSSTALLGLGALGCLLRRKR